MAEEIDTTTLARIVSMLDVNEPVLEKEITRRVECYGDGFDIWGCDVPVRKALDGWNNAKSTLKALSGVDNRESASLWGTLVREVFKPEEVDLI